MQYILKKKGSEKFVFSALQSGFSKELGSLGYQIPEDMSTLVYIKKGKTLIKSTAALNITGELKGLKWMRVFSWIPRFIRDGVYFLIAKFRKKLAKPYCYLPTQEQKSQFRA